MNVALCQLEIAWEDKAANHAKVRAMLVEAKLPRESLVVLPEMFATGFSMNVARISDIASKDTQRFLSEAAREFGVYIIAGIVTQGPDGRGRNEAAVLAPDGREIARYCKLHPFRFAGETDHYAPGEQIRLFDCHPFRIAPFICYDLRVPEIFRMATRGGAQLLVVIANWPAAREQHWITLLAARAIENQAYVVGVNRVGTDGNGHRYSGDSRIIDPLGEVVASAAYVETTLTADVDPAVVSDVRTRFPFLVDRRVAPIAYLQSG
jgi:omega-amidase